VITKSTLTKLPLRTGSRRVARMHSPGSQKLVHELRDEYGDNCNGVECSAPL
jgi:hypothetical protein